VLKEGAWDWDVEGELVKRYVALERWQSLPIPEPRQTTFTLDMKFVNET
jgi:hypothetical protein